VLRRDSRSACLFPSQKRVEEEEKSVLLAGLTIPSPIFCLFAQGLETGATGSQVLRRGQGVGERTQQLLDGGIP
jgi:hypothetical protein